MRMREFASCMHTRLFIGTLCSLSLPVTSPVTVRSKLTWVRVPRGIASSSDGRLPCRRRLWDRR